ncbi:hypothetical protein V5F50_19860 [Xanthobacter sp. V13C-7B]|uniref:hypothetical protein n=1 Tax=Xanthobacter variabilis TaxID=3119932 RepID=UPI003728DE24
MNYFRGGRGVVAALLCSALGGCLLPEKMKVDVTLNNSEYRMQAAGVLFDPGYVKAARDGRVFSEAEEARMAKQAESGSRMPGYGKVAYEGRGRFAVSIDLTGTLGGEKRAVGLPDTRKSEAGRNYLEIERQPDGAVVVRSAKVSERVEEQVQSLKVPLDVEVSVTTANVVAENNADRHEGNTYYWRLKSLRDVVFLRTSAVGGTDGRAHD